MARAVPLLLPTLSWALHLSGPRFAAVDGDIETIWQRPSGEVKGIFFMAHGCHHQAGDFWEPSHQLCASTARGRCLGLPEHLELRRVALRRGYVALAVSSQGRCWGKEASRVQQAVDYVRRVERLWAVPLLATGSSSGGHLLGELQNATCLAPQNAAMEPRQAVATLFLHMPRDVRTAEGVHRAVQSLRSQGARAEALPLRPRPVTVDFLKRCLALPEAQALVRALQEQKLVDSEGFLLQDPRRGLWAATARKLLPGQSMVPDESCLSSELNVAYAFHETSAESAQSIFDFCEGLGPQPRLLQRQPLLKPVVSKELQVRLFSPMSWVPLKGAALVLQEREMEWDYTATKLAERGFEVLMPELEANHDGDFDISVKLQSLLRALGRRECGLVLGSGWGAALAIKLAAHQALQVKQLILVEPSRMTAWPKHVEVALFLPKSQELDESWAQPSLLKNLKLFRMEQGFEPGKPRKLDSYTPVILELVDDDS